MRAAVLVGWLVILSVVGIVGCAVVEESRGGAPAPASTIEGKIAQKEAARLAAAEEPLYDRLQDKLDSWPSAGAKWPNLFWQGVAVLGTAALSLGLSTRALLRKTAPLPVPAAVVLVTSGLISVLAVPLGLWLLGAAFSEDFGR